MPSLEETRRTISRRLNELQRQAAFRGISADPSITMEIQDLTKQLENLDDMAQTIKLIELHRKHLGTLLQQLGTFGAAHVPPHVVSEIERDRANIRHLIAECRKRGVVIESQPGDEPAPSPPPSTHWASNIPPTPSVSHDAIKEVLDSAIWYLKNNYTAEALRSLENLRNRM